MKKSLNISLSIIIDFISIDFDLHLVVFIQSYKSYI